jgi:hypothetical protein
VGWIENKVEEIAGAVVLEGERTRSELAESFAKTMRGQRIDGALSRPVRPNAANYSARGRLVGWSVQATGGPVRIVVHDGLDAGGDVIAIVDLADQENQTQWMGPGGVAFVDGLYAECTGTGTLTGAMWIGAVD